MTELMPALFVGHGNPMNAITDNPYRRAWQAWAVKLPRPHAILCVSAHWETVVPAICSADPPKTIHDFGGFPPALYAQQYPAPGAPALVAQVQSLLGLSALVASPDWGLDHGAWSVLASLYPKADVPVAQLSLGRSLSPMGHLKLARQLAALRRAGVMLVASGNIVHNLRRLGSGPAPDWARDFDQYCAQAIERGDDDALVNYAAAPGSQMAVPTPEHYLPLLYAVGMRQPEDRLEFFNSDFDLGSLSMRSFVLAPA